ncbi:MAG: GatB/YqeY domain-containing protein [Anaerolineales bacterium]|nr:GatB/YqeY domain-containing protein [Anaerolineales bacterium]
MNIMNTKDQLQNDLKEALVNKDVIRKATIRMALAAIKNAEIDKRHELEDSEIQAILQKEVKSRRETIEDAKRAKRPDIITENESEIEILETYLPQQISTDEINLMAREAIDEVGATSPREIGQVMKVLMPRVRGQADGREVNQIVTQLLA